MKTKLLLVTLLFCSGCSLLPGGPKSTVKKFIDSGHPLLRAEAVSAAYNAKFSPTRVGGKPVKVTGVINYNFVAE